MAFRLQLALYDENNTIISIEEYLKQKQQGAIAWQADLEDTTFIFECDGHELIANAWNLGKLKYLALQCEAALERLGNGQVALIRSGILEESVPYLLIEPGSENICYTSLFLMDDPDMAFTFPIDGISGRSADLYTYVAQHREALLDAAANMGKDYFVEMQCPYDEILGSLQREARLAKNLLDSPG